MDPATGFVALVNCLGWLFLLVGGLGVAWVAGYTVLELVRSLHYFLEDTFPLTARPEPQLPAARWFDLVTLFGALLALDAAVWALCLFRPFLHH